RPTGNTRVLSAGDFVPIAEQSGMMRAIDAELFAQVCRDVSELSRIAPGIRVSVNVSAKDLNRASLLADIESTMQRFSIAPAALRIEITETAVMQDAQRALAMLEELRSRGLEIVVDDFGAGYSSLSYLQRLPLGGVKIDRSFISSLPGDEQTLEIVRAIVALSKALGLHTTAEGVETPEQFDAIRRLGIDYAQGFWFSPAVDFETAKSHFAIRS
ncbi:MAG: EAL domain-containing protein, partial [Candidatus Eremiobacteraeota bacterium]|nr:EAL domain-containing protein [Candidatus Eremiobacteraeota bacterium]